MENVMDYLELAGQKLIDFAPIFVKAALIIVIGFWLIKKIGALLRFSLERAKMAPEVTSFLSSVLDVGLKILLLIITASVVGIEMTSLVAIMAAAGFAVGLALQGSLSNFAAGIMIMVFKPYKVHDYVEISDKFGRVESIQIFNTAIVTPGQKVHIIPNGQVVEGVITNFSMKGQIRLELQVSMPYEESFPKVRKIILDALKNVPDIIKETEPMVGIESYDSHNVILAVRPFIQPDHYWDVTFASYEAIKAAFNKHGIKMAYSEGVELGSIGE